MRGALTSPLFCGGRLPRLSARPFRTSPARSNRREARTTEPPYARPPCREANVPVAWSPETRLPIALVLLRGSRPRTTGVFSFTLPGVVVASHLPSEALRWSAPFKSASDRRPRATRARHGMSLSPAWAMRWPMGRTGSLTRPGSRYIPIRGS
jgi:hypothetical protein